jgi:replicative DNA helicase
VSDLDQFENSVEEIEAEAKMQKLLRGRKTFSQMLDKYKSKEPAKDFMDLRKWLPSLANILGYLVPGEMFCMLADTGSGKTAFMQQMIMKACAPLKTLLLEMELPDDQLMERFISMKTLESSKSSLDIAKSGRLDSITKDFDHLITYSEMKFTVQDIEEIIDYEKPKIVIIDYMGIIRANGKSRYERLSDISEELKLLSLTKNVVMIVSCQIHRDPNKASGEIFLHDARDSSSIENSSQKMIGIWREGEDGNILKVKVLKNQGLRDRVLNYNFNNDNLTIYQG